jgi:hypothetical protein
MSRVRDDNAPGAVKMRLLIACLLMTISTILAAIDVYVRLNPPKIETVPEPAQDRQEAPLRSGTKVKERLSK